MYKSEQSYCILDSQILNFHNTLLKEKIYKSLITNKLIC